MTGQHDDFVRMLTQRLYSGNKRAFSNNLVLVRIQGNVTIVVESNGMLSCCRCLSSGVVISCSSSWRPSPSSRRQRKRCSRHVEVGDKTSTEGIWNLNLFTWKTPQQSRRHPPLASFWRSSPTIICFSFSIRSRRVLCQHTGNKNAPRKFPKVWHLLEKRIREHPNEAREVYNTGLPIHFVLRFSGYQYPNTAAPLSLVQLLIELHPDGLHIQDHAGCIPLRWAVDHPCIDCFRAVLYNGGVEATTIQCVYHGRTALHWSTYGKVSLATSWELLRFNRGCITIQDDRGRTALELLDNGYHQYCRYLEDRYQYRLNAKIVLLKLAANYNHVPNHPSEDVSAEIDSHPACTVLALRLEPDNDAFILQPSSVESQVPRYPC